MQGPQQNVVWSRSDPVEQKLQPSGLIEQVVVVEVELYSPAVQWVQVVVVVVGCSRVMRGAPRNRQCLGLMPINPLS